MNLKWVADHFDKMQYLLLAGILFIAWNAMRAKQEKTNFRTREADRPDLNKILKGGEDFANSKLKSKQTPTAPPLALPGIRLSGEAHEILGVAANASTAEVLRAYKEKIKLFHPDRIQGQAREQLKFYEDASAKINQAKEDMLSRKK